MIYLIDDSKYPEQAMHIPISIPLGRKSMQACHTKKTLLSQGSAFIDKKRTFRQDGNIPLVHEP